jgi:flagellar capping protein FliD
LRIARPILPGHPADPSPGSLERNPMSEINNSMRAGQKPQQPQQQLQLPQAQPQAAVRGGPEPTVASANRLTGLASGLNTEKTIETLMLVEQRRLKPIQEQKASTLQELKSFEIVNQGLQNINGTVEQLKGAAIWDGKIIESSNEQIVTATATTGAKPGKHTLIVDKLALNHQIASQGYETQDAAVGTGKFLITVGEGSPITVVIDESANTLAGLKDAINFATKEVNATIIKTGSRTAPYQLVLTSQKTGSVGRINLDVQLKGGTPPNFSNSVEEPSPWQGVGEAAEKGKAPLKGIGASTAIVKVIGEYTGSEDNKYTFTAVQSGEVGGQKQLQMRWKDDHGHSGLINLDALNYAPGEPIEFTDGLALVFSEGDVIVNDSFSFTTRAERSDLSWWVPPDQRPSAVSVPTAWHRQRTEAFGAPIVEGTYTGKEDQDFKLTVQGSGQVGRAQNLSISWQAEDGEVGVLNVGDGYEPGSPLALTQGLTVTLKPGVLSEGAEATFHVTPEERSSRWWLPDQDRVVDAKIGEVSNWKTPGVSEEEAGGTMPELPEGLGPRTSTVKVALGGAFSGDEAKVYTFTALRDGAVGTTKDLKIGWDDSQGNKGELSVGEAYQPGTPLPLAEGLTVAFGPGRLFKDDTFTVRTRTSTVQPPQDAAIRFGATELGGGLPITSPTNDLENVIEGVHLNLVASSDKPVTITIRGDTEKAFQSVKTFVDQYNELAAVIAELVKFDKENNVAGPLLGNRDLANIQNELSDLLINPVAGLPKSSNMVMAVGINLDDKGQLRLDESALQGKIAQDFSQVADLFRAKGDSDNSNVAFVGMTDATAVSALGYAVDIAHPATQGHYETPPLGANVVLTEQNNRFFVSVDGRQSELLTLPAGVYSVGGYARALQDAITNDKVVGQSRVRVVPDGDKVRILSGRFGSNSAIAFVPGAEGGRIGVGLMEGQSVNGTNVEGTIDGKAAEGNGQLLRAPDKSGPASGMRVYVKLAESQLKPGPEATVKITKGVASRMSTYLTRIVNPLTGDMRRITQNLRDQVGSLDAQLKRMEERMAAKRQRLQERFSRLESQLSTLKQQQSYMQSQLGGLGGGGSVLPGMPPG